MKALEPKIRAWAVELIDAIAARGSCEFIGDFSKHFPTGIFIDMMGLPRDLLGRFVDWENRLLNGTSAQERTGALREILDYLRETIHARRAGDGADGPRNRTTLSFGPYDHKGHKGTDNMVVRRLTDGKLVMEGRFAPVAG